LIDTAGFEEAHKMHLWAFGQAMATGRRIMIAPNDAWGPLPPHTDHHQSGLWRILERFFLIAGLLFLGYSAYVVIESRLYQAFENRELDRILSTPPPATERARRTPPVPGSVIGRIEIPRLGVSAVIRAGSDARTLRLAVGHIAGTALPGESGNIGLAGHRDTFFRRLRDIQPDDEIRIVAPEGTYAFRVENTSVVEPRDTWVLDATPSPALTLVTCYPFTYIGSAPERFIVRAGLIPVLRSRARASPPHVPARAVGAGTPLLASQWSPPSVRESRAPSRPGIRRQAPSVQSQSRLKRYH
jgi:sortase A